MGPLKTREKYGRAHPKGLKKKKKEDVADCDCNFWFKLRPQPITVYYSICLSVMVLGKGWYQLIGVSSNE